MRTSTVTNAAASPRPFVVAHRAGNDLRRLREAAALGLPLAEADVHLYRGRLEVRHLKTAGPLPLLWDRWELASPRAPRLELATLLAAAADGPRADARPQGPRPRGCPTASPPRSQSAGTAGRVTVCSQDWRLLEPLRGSPDVRRRPLGRQRPRAGARFAGASRASALAGVSIHRRLLDTATVRELRARAALILSWPVETVPEAPPPRRARRGRPDQAGVRGARGRARPSAARRRPRDRRGCGRRRPSVLGRFGDVDPRLVVAALALHVVNHLLRSVAWRNVLGAAYPAARVAAARRRVRLRRRRGAERGRCPARGGDAAKVALVRMRVAGSTVPTIASTMSVVVLFDLVAATAAPARRSA